MINDYVDTVALKIANELTPDNPAILYNSIIAIVDLVDNTFRNWNISPALKSECISDAISKSLFPILESARSCSGKEKDYTFHCTIDILRAYKKSYEKDLEIALDRFKQACYNNSSS